MPRRSRSWRSVSWDWSCELNAMSTWLYSIKQPLLSFVSPGFPEFAVRIAGLHPWGGWFPTMIVFAPLWIRFCKGFCFWFFWRGYKLVFPPHTHPVPTHHPRIKTQAFFLQKINSVQKIIYGFQQSASTKMIRTQPS